MQYGIIKSVGHKGSNESSDVKFVQTCLNANKDRFKSPYSPVAVDGLCREKTINAIKQFQKECVGKPNPDGRVDPDATTIQFLTMYLPKKPDSSSKVVAAPVAAPAASTVGLGDLVVSFASDDLDKAVVSDYTLSVIKMALKRCNMTHAVITSTLRSPERQARIMYENSLQKYNYQVTLYGGAKKSGSSAAPGRGAQLLEIFINNKEKGASAVQALMTAKINEFLKRGEPGGSNHCVPREEYIKRNVVDIGVRSTQQKSKNFSKGKFGAALQSLCDEGYIARYLDESINGGNNCWHIEVLPFVKDIHGASKGSMAQLRKYINGAPTYV